MNLKTISSIFTLVIVSACLSVQSTQSVTDPAAIPTPSDVLPSETPFVVVTSTTNPCIVRPQNLLLQSTYSTDLSSYGITMESTTDPVLSPDNRYLAVSLSEVKGDNYLSHLTVLNLEDHTALWLFEYPSVNWSSVEIAWSPDSQAVAFLPRNVAFVSDSGLRLFDLAGQLKYKHENVQHIVGWIEESDKLYFSYKDGIGFMNMQDGAVTFGEMCQ